MYTEHRLVQEGLPENSVANLHGITVVRVRLKPDKRKISYIATNYENTMCKDKNCHEITSFFLSVHRSALV